MFAKAVHITHHCVLRMLKRYREWQAFTDDEIKISLSRLVFETGSPVGGQIDNNIAVEITLPSTGEKIYLVGHTTTQTFVVRTVLSREQLVANIRRLGLRSPQASPKHEKRRHKRFKKTEKYIQDHAEDFDEKPFRTKRDQRRRKLHRPRFDDETFG